MKISIRNQYNAPKGKKQNKHQEIYKYQYLDKKTGEIVEKEINVQEQIQSNLSKVDYKKMIANGELIMNGIGMEQSYRDYTSISGDKVDIINTLTEISKYTPEQIAEILKTLAEQSTTEQSQDSQENGEITITTTQTEPDIGGMDSQTNEGSTT